MTSGIYCIKCNINNKRYIGQSSDIKTRVSSLKCALSKLKTNKNLNHWLHADVFAYGIDNFTVEILENTDIGVSDKERLLLESLWMDVYNTTDRSYGYNIRQDTVNGYICHSETKRKLSDVNSGVNNPNYGNKWSDEQKRIARVERYLRLDNGIGSMTDAGKRKVSIASINLWKDKTKKSNMAAKVSKTKCKKHKFLQFDKLTHELIKTWDSVKDIVNENPGYKWQNIYSVCNGYKKSYRGFIWKKELKI